MRNVKLILVLILVGIGLIVAGALRMDMNARAGQLTAPASLTASWTTGLIGVALLTAGLFLLRRGYVAARVRMAGNPPQEKARPTRVFLIIAGALAAVALVAFLLSMTEHTSAPTQARTPVARDGSSPAPTPDMPKSYQPR